MSEPHKFPYRLVAFDLDGTLAPSKGIVLQSIATLISRLTEKTLVTIISGGSFHQFEKQLLVFLSPNERTILLPTEGSERYEYTKELKWNLISSTTFPQDIKTKVVAELEDIIKSGAYNIPKEHFGEYIEDRGTEIAFSGLGQEAPLDMKEVWDPDRSKRMKIKETLESNIPDISVAIAGTTSINILPGNFNKGKGLLLLADSLGIKKNEIIFVGDALVHGANDYSVLEAGIETLSVSGPIETEHLLQKWLGLPVNPIAYFCSEYAFGPDSAMYAGGLGILAGDYVLEARDQDKPFIALGLKYGSSQPEGFELSIDEVFVPIGEDTIKVKVWHKEFSPNVHVFLLDGGDLTAHLYDTDFMIRMKQQMILGIGGVRLLSQLGITPRIYHLNEGHTAFVGIALMLEHPSELRKIVATKHTILSAAGTLITYEELNSLIGLYCREYSLTTDVIFKKGEFELNTKFFSTTKLIMILSTHKNAVSAVHAVFEKKRHPHSTLISVTNGVYRPRWQADELRGREIASTDEDIWNIKRSQRLELFKYIEKNTGVKLNPDICTLVWARRFAAYKRPYLLFSNKDRLMNIITNQHTPLQCIISGKAQLGDKDGQGVINQIIEFTQRENMRGRIVYLPDYSMTSATMLTRGADIWLNTPEKGMEACGTSGMKAGLNGALQCSVSDGWVDEVQWGGRGWILPEEDTAPVLYDLLEHEILPCFYARQNNENTSDFSPEWVAKMRSTIELVENSYTSGRMLSDYEDKLYRPTEAGQLS